MFLLLYSNLFGDRNLIAEGPIMEGKKEAKEKYLILLTDVLICAAKVEDEDYSLVFEWKVDLCTSEILFTRHTDGLLILFQVINNIIKSIL